MRSHAQSGLPLGAVGRFLKIRAIANLLAVCCVVILGACEYTGRPDNALEKRFTWLSFLAGEDLKESCRNHAPPRYRFVYNAMAASTSRRNTCVKFLCRRFKPQRFAWSFVQLPGHPIQIRL